MAFKSAAPQQPSATVPARHQRHVQRVARVVQPHRTGVVTRPNTVAMPIHLRQVYGLKSRSRGSRGSRGFAYLVARFSRSASTPPLPPNSSGRAIKK